MDVSRSRYYKWLYRKNNSSAKDIRVKEDSKFIINVFNNHKSHGYRWLTHYINNRYGTKYNENYVFKILQYNFLRSKSKHYQWQRPLEEHETYKNLIWNNCDKIDKTYEVVVSDMTRFYIKGKVYELTFCIDVFNNEILTYGLASREDSINSYYDGLGLLLNKLKKEQTSLSILHTDQGSVYSSKSYNALLSTNSIQHSMSRAGTPTDYPANESLNGWIKEGLLIDFDLKNSDNVQETIGQYVHYYNYIRPAYALNYKTPIQYKVELGFEHFL